MVFFLRRKYDKKSVCFLCLLKNADGFFSKLIYFFILFEYNFFLLHVFSTTAKTFKQVSCLYAFMLTVLYVLNVTEVGCSCVSLHTHTHKHTHPNKCQLTVISFPFFFLSSFRMLSEYTIVNKRVIRKRVSVEICYCLAVLVFEINEIFNVSIEFKTFCWF